MMGISPVSWSATVTGTAQPDEPSTEPSDNTDVQPTPTAPNTGSTTGNTGSNSNSNDNSGNVQNSSGSSSGSANKDRVPKTGDATMNFWTLTVLAAGASVTILIAGRKVFSK